VSACVGVHKSSTLFLLATWVADGRIEVRRRSGTWVLCLDSGPCGKRHLMCGISFLTADSALCVSFAKALSSSFFFVFLGMTVANQVAAQLIGSFVALIAMIFSGYLLQVVHERLNGVDERSHLTRWSPIVLLLLWPAEHTSLRDRNFNSIFVVPTSIL